MGVPLGGNDQLPPPAWTRRLGDTALFLSKQQLECSRGDWKPPQADGEHALCMRTFGSRMWVGLASPVLGWCYGSPHTSMFMSDYETLLAYKRLPAVRNRWGTSLATVLIPVTGCGGI